jgi:hypothetical protein
MFCADALVLFGGKAWGTQGFSHIPISSLARYYAKRMSKSSLLLFSNFEAS